MSGAVEGDDLTVKDSGPAGQEVREFAQLRVAGGHVEVVAGQHPHNTAIDVGDGADTVPFELERPA